MMQISRIYLRIKVYTQSKYYSITSSVAANVPHPEDTKSDVATRHVVVYDYVQQNVIYTNRHVCTVHGVNGFKSVVKQVTGTLLTLWLTWEQWKLAFEFFSSLQFIHPKPKTKRLILNPSLNTFQSIAVPQILTNGHKWCKYDSCVFVHQSIVVK